MPGQVTVACKLPHGLILRLYRMEDHDEPQFGGGYKTVRRAVRADTCEVVIKGFAHRRGEDMPHEIRGGAGLTHGVDADFFIEWMKQNKDADYIKNGLVFAQPKREDIDAQIKAHRSLKSGFEPVDPNNLPPEFKGRIAITTADEQDAF